MRFVTCLCLVLVISSAIDAKRRGGSSSSRRGPTTSNRRTTTQSPRTPPPYHSVDSTGSNNFLNAERGPPRQPTNTNGPIGFEGIGGATNQGNHKIGFDKVNSEVQNNHGAPQYPNGPPPYRPSPAYPGYNGGGNDPGRPMNAPPPYQAGNSYYNQNQQGSFNNYPNQFNPHQGNGFGNNYNQNNQFGNSGHGFGTSSFPGNSGYGGNSFGGGGSPPFGSSYQGNNFGGSPFGGGYNGNPSYNPNNFGYSNYPGQYNNYQQKSRFGGLPIPIPIPIPLGGGFGSGLFGGHSNNHRLLNSFIKSNTTTGGGNSSTSVFLLNNSTVAPCTTDHWEYDLLKVTVLSCTAEHCTAIKVTTTTTNTSQPSVHSASFIMCLEEQKNSTVSYHGYGIVPTLSEVKNENMTVCQPDVSVKPVNVTVKPVNETSNTTENTTTEITTTEVTTTTDMTTTEMTTTTGTITTNTTKKCENASCSLVEMCLPFIEILDHCKGLDCPFRRTGYKPCVTLKMCHSPNTPVSTYATLNTTISKIDEFNHHNSVYDAANLTLISYHRPVISFNCSQSSPGCVPPSSST